MTQSMIDALVTVLTIAGVIMSIVLHEIAHGWVAYKCGDMTAKAMGRLTLNPVPHIDPFMSVLVPIVTYFSTGGALLFGAAKPVPVNPNRLRHHRRDMLLVSIAGVTANLLIAIACALLFHVHARLTDKATVASAVLVKVAMSNVGLMIFNLLPVPPLDGSKVVPYFLSYSGRESWRRFELMLGGWGFLLAAMLPRIPPFDYLFAWVYTTVLRILFWI
jgi:Zn-dependent protease